MSQLDSNSVDPTLDPAVAPRGVIVQKPKTNIYTVMLIIAFLAMCLGCLFLWLEQREYSSDQAAQLAPPPALVIDASDSALV